ncbi:MAG TPA: hypothetical protein DCR43_02905 [Bacteroidales bacterium]|nr:hypothetical protein [Bacteroidales bacterium]
MTTREELAVIIELIGGTFSTYKVDAESINGIMKSFELFTKDMSKEDLLASFISWCDENPGQYAPTPIQLRNQFKTIKMKNTGLETGSAVWAECRESIVRMPAGNLSGGGSSPILDHPATMETLRRMGGFPQICLDIENGQESFTRSRFLKIYDEVVDSIRSEISEHPALTDYDNRALEEKTRADIKMLADKFGGRR